MPDYQIEGPNGQAYIITAPEGATEQEVRAMAADYISSQQPKAAPPAKKDAPPIDTPPQTQKQAVDKAEAAQSAMEQEAKGTWDTVTEMADVYRQYLLRDTKKKLTTIGDVGTAFAATAGMGFVGALDGVVGATVAYFQDQAGSKRDIDVKKGKPPAPMDIAAQRFYNSLEAAYRPRSPEGIEFMQDFAMILEPIQQKVQDGSFWLSRGNPDVATAIETAIMGGPEFLIPTLRGKNGIAMSTIVNSARANARKFGINLDPLEIELSILQRAEDMSAGRVRGGGTASAVAKLREDAAKSRRRVSIRYAQARETPAWMNTGNLEDWAGNVRQEIMGRGWDINDMPTAQRRLAELENIRTHNPVTGEPWPEGTTAAQVQFRVIDLLQRRNNRHRHKPNERGDMAPGAEQENAVLSIIGQQMDEFIDNQFNSLAIGGDPAAIERWRRARGTARRHAENFKEDKFIRQMIQRGATGTEYRQWIIGADTASAKPVAVNTVNKLKELLGEDSPQFDALKTDLLMDTLSPLLQGPTPNFRGFVRKYDRMIANRPELMKALGLEESQLRFMRDAAEAAIKVGPGKAFGLDLTTLAARFTVGHRIARAAARVMIVKQLMDAALRTGRTGKNDIIRELTGVNMNAPFISKKDAAFGMVVASELNLDNKEARDYLDKLQRQTGEIQR